jgi:superfamily I DNA/RNA helicase
MTWNTGLTGAALNIAQIDTRVLRVMAGPGTGKTFAMKRRVMRLLEEGAAPECILAVTFTRTAAASLVKELKDLGVPGCENIEARTLHSFCFSVLTRREVFEYLDRTSRPLVTFSDKGVLQFEAAPMLRDLISENGSFGASRDCSKRILAFEAAWARRQSDTPGWPLDPLDHLFHDALLNWLRFHNAMLIGELVPEALRYLRNNPACPEIERFDHVIVDEYQDLNKAEQDLLDVLATNSALAVVGDEDQSIYRFRHAHPEGIREFGTVHTATHDEHLVECRRCGTRIVEMASHLIRHNHINAGNAAVLQPLPGNPTGEVHIVQWSSLQEEADGLATYIQHLVINRHYSPADILVLSPRRLIGQGIRDALVSLNVPAHSFYHEEALLDDSAQVAFTLLTLLADKQDRVALRFWLGFGSPSWREGEYRVLRQYCEQSGSSPWDAMEAIDVGALQLNHTGQIRERFRLLKMKLGNLTGSVGPALVEQLFPDQQSWAKPLREAALLKINDTTDAGKLLDALRTSVTQPEMPEAGEFVRIMSLHKSKGLTSKITIAAGCMQGLIPGILRNVAIEEQRAHLQEQRRLFYVAITRAQEILVLSSAIRLELQVAHKIGARVQIPTGRTFATGFIGELGPAAPGSQNGAIWRLGGFT